VRRDVLPFQDDSFTELLLATGEGEQRDQAGATYCCGTSFA
jgi:hypothetical protein